MDMDYKSAGAPCDVCTLPPGNCPLVSDLKRQRWRQSVFAAVLMGAFGGGALLGIGWVVWTLSNPPLIYLSSKIVSTDMVAGGDLRFMVTSRPSLDRACLGTITREFYSTVTYEGEPIRLKKRRPGAPPIVHENETKYLVDVELPTRMDPGPWTFQGETTYDCGFLWALFNDFPTGFAHGGVIRLRTPEMAFDIKKAP